MELLAQARHYVGLRFAFFKVFVPTTVLLFFVVISLVLIPFTASFFTEEKNLNYLFALTGIIGTMYFIVAPCAYFLAQKNTTWVHKELQDWIRIEEEIILPLLREELSQREKLLTQHIQDRRKNLNTVWLKNQNELLAESQSRIQIQLDRMQGLLVGATVQKQLKHQEHYIAVHQTIRMLEGLKHSMSQKSATPLSDDEYLELSMRLQASFESGVQFLTELVQDQQELIGISQNKIVEAKEFLSE